MDTVTRARTQEKTKPTQQGAARNALLLFLASFLVLYFELVVIRFLSSEIRVFAYLKNLALVASFFGIGLGMISGRPLKTIQRGFPFFTALLFLLIAFAPWLHLTHLPIPGGYHQMFGHRIVTPGPWIIFWSVAYLWLFFLIVPSVLFLVVRFFGFLGALVGERLAMLAPLPAYGWNLAGSLAGILVFTFISFSSAPPAVWLLVGAVFAVPLLFRQPWSLVTLVALACVLVLPPVRHLRGLDYGFGRNRLPQLLTLWSPYYRITLYEVPTPPGWVRPPDYLIDVNHDYHQTIADLSAEFMSHDFAAMNREALEAYNLPYRLSAHPKDVLIVGAGTGNDVAAALRNGAEHVDAVEIDPTLVKIGRKYHPEHPYDSPKVSVFVNDARAFFKRTDHKYDLIVFAFLDSQTMFSSLSVLRLDDYVYTRESFSEARQRLAPNGTAVIAFASGRSTFITDRLFLTLMNAFGKAPDAYFTGYASSGVVFVEANGPHLKLSEYPEITEELLSRQAGAIMSTDHWPFLYLESKTIPFPVIGVVILFLTFSLGLLRRRIPISRVVSGQNRHLLLLGAGFMLLETKAVTQLSLLYGSTWIVNAVVISAFLVMGLLANTLMSFGYGSRRVSYLFLFLLLALDLFIPYSAFAVLPQGTATLIASSFAALPIFFSGVIFSRAFREVQRPAEGLGVNLLGAVIGGVLENVVMIGGTPMLGALAILLYGLSAICFTEQHTEKRTELLQGFRTDSSPEGCLGQPGT